MHNSLTVNCVAFVAAIEHCLLFNIRYTSHTHYISFCPSRWLRIYYLKWSHNMLTFVPLILANFRVTSKIRGTHSISSLWLDQSLMLWWWSLRWDPFFSGKGGTTKKTFFLLAEKLHQCGVSASIQSCKAHQTPAPRLHHSHSSLDLCAVIQGTALRLPSHGSSLLHLRNHRNAGN